MRRDGITRRRNDHPAYPTGSRDNPSTGRPNLFEDVLSVLHPHRRVRRHHRRQAERPRRRQVRRVGADLRAVPERAPLEIEGVHAGGVQEVVALVVHVVARGAAHREEAPRPKVEVQATGEALDALGGGNSGGLCRREESVPASWIRHVREGRGRVEREPEQPAREDPEGVIVVLWERQIARHVGARDRQIHQLADLVVQVDAQVGLLEVVRLEDALLTLEIPGHVERGGLVAPRDVHTVLLAHPLPERRVLLERVEAVHGDHRAASQGLGRQAAGPAVAPAGEIVRRPLSRVVQHGAFEISTPLRGPGPPLLGSDLDHAVGRVRTVQRRRGRTLDHFHRLPVLRVEIVETRRRLPARRAQSAVGVRDVVHAHAVHDDDRLIAEREAGRAPDPDAGPGPGGPAALHHLHARHAGVEEICGVRRQGGLRDGGRVDRPHVAAALALELFLSSGRYDDHIQRHGGRCEHEVGGRGLTSGHGDRARRGRVADQPDLDLVLARRHVREREATFAGGASLQAGADDDHRGARHRLVRLVRHLPSDGAALRLHRLGDHPREQQDRRRAAEQLANAKCVHGACPHPKGLGAGSGRRGHTLQRPRSGAVSRPSRHPVGQLRQPTGDYICSAIRVRRRTRKKDGKRTTCGAYATLL